MRVGIDARFLTHPQPGGFKTYTESLVSALSRVDTENEYILYTDRQPLPQDRIPRQENFRTRIVPGVAPLIGVPWREQAALALRARKDRIDIFHAPCLTAPMILPCPLVVTVHDMIWAFPEYFTGRGTWSLKRRVVDWYNYLVPKRTIRRAAAIITVSQASKESIVERLNMPSEKIVVTHEAAGAVFQKINDPSRIEAIRKKYDLPSKFLLAIGTADPRKNIKSLIRAYRMLPDSLKEEHKLVIVWTHPLVASEISRQIEESGLMQKVFILKHVPNDDLALLYNAAVLFVFPSRFEGFGLPLLEAMSCGVPVIAADNSSIPEIAGDAAVYFDALNTQQMAEALMRVLNDEELRTTLIQKGAARAGTFSWAKCASETIGVYAKTLPGRRA